MSTPGRERFPGMVSGKVSGDYSSPPIVVKPTQARLAHGGRVEREVTLEHGARTAGKSAANVGGSARIERGTLALTA